jgi:acyl-CoA synthetase (AMP-forming)/AMP-acid ligase II/acyl carrier protein
VAQNVLSLETMLGRERVTLLNTVPSAGRALLERGAIPETAGVVNLAGEPLKSGLVNELYGQSGIKRVYDLYGPSEATTYSTYTQRERGGVETIGRPVANTQVYVLDGWGRVQGVGVVGELYIGGVGLARGYLGRAGLTAERFVPNAYAAEGGSRLYRTGDLVRHLEDGKLEYVGRADQQVKVRGFRIELGEIESVLLGHAAVKEAVVLAREAGPWADGERAERAQPGARHALHGGGREAEPWADGERAERAQPDEPERKQLVAYVVAEAGEGKRLGEGLGSELRGYLQGQLPGYMVPAVFVVLDVLPLTANGKVDRKALPAPHGDAYGRKLYEAPEDEIERTVGRIWEELLGVERVGRQDNFFELGGHSLLAMQLVSRVRGTLSVEIEIRSVYDYSSLRNFAQHIDKLIEVDSLDEERLESMTEEEAEQLLSELSAR